MKKINSLLVVILSLLILGNTMQSASAETEIEIKKVILVTGSSGEPYSLLSENNDWSGIDAEMWAEIEERTGWEIELKRAAFESLFGELDTKRADIAVNCFAIKDERAEKYLPSYPYYGDAQSVFVNIDNKDIKTFDDLAGKKVGVHNGQASQTIIEEMSKEVGFEMVVYEETATALQDLALGRLDAVGHTITAVNNFSNSNNIEFRKLEENLLPNNVAYFMTRDERGTQIKEELDNVIQEMLEDGTIAEITEKWLFADMTENISVEDYEKTMEKYPLPSTEE